MKMWRCEGADLANKQGQWIHYIRDTTNDIFCNVSHLVSACVLMLCCWISYHMLTCWHCDVSTFFIFSVAMFCNSTWVPFCILAFRHLATLDILALLSIWYLKHVCIFVFWYFLIFLCFGILACWHFGHFWFLAFWHLGALGIFVFLPLLEFGHFFFYIFAFLCFF